VRVHEDGTARVGAGALLIDVYDRLARRGRAIPAGSCPTVGIAGLALGGGHGFASRKHGLTCDAVAGLTIVTADARVLECDESENADLYWACRGGGGGNFGVVTGLTFRTYAAQDVSTFVVEWPWALAAAAVERWQRWAPEAPDELFSVLNVRSPGGGAAPRITAVGQLLGSEAELRSLVGGLVAADSPSRVAVTSRSHMAAVFYWAACGGSVGACRNAPRSTFAAKSAFALRPLTPEGVRALVGAIEARGRDQRLGSGGVLLDSYGGAINRVPAGATAFVHRTARFSLQKIASWQAGDPDSVVAANTRWLRSFHAALRPHVSRFAYQNYIDRDLVDWKDAYYGANLGRLRRVKRRHDPDFFFRFPQAIPPA
jgi:FAD/FMN-containing dehydrogenase